MSGTIPTGENPRATPSIVKPFSPRWEAERSSTEMGNRRENSPTNDIVQHDSHVRKSGVGWSGIELGSPWWEESWLTARPPWPQWWLRNMRVGRGEYGAVPECKGCRGGAVMGDPRGNPPTSVRHDSHERKSGSDPTSSRIRVNLPRKRRCQHWCYFLDMYGSDYDFTCSVEQVYSGRGGENVEVKSCLSYPPHPLHRQLAAFNYVTRVADSYLTAFLLPGEVFIFAETPHLLKLTRNHFLDDGFESSSSEEIHKFCVQKILDFTFKFSQRHLDVPRTQRQRVKRAEYLLSNKANAIIKRIFESYSTFLTIGDTLSTQEKTSLHTDYTTNWNKTSFYQRDECICLVRVMDHRNQMTFLLGIRVVNKSLKNLFHYLKGKYEIT
ncbi:hypothetical protein PR048_025799 [Dryococelus australis]|uniref:Uncharacterized protein n=1 Tax=Dryococelus australis TaxID=614101 RepID=A0ABQ9GJK1_9NEOP|nr:hypothetical protein PR048_025799 [Dryococelus australis]